MEKMEVFREFIAKTQVLIVDKNPSSRNRLLKIMADLGCNRNMAHTCGTLSEAEDIFNTHPIGIVLSDYFIGGGSGFDLISSIRQRQAKDTELILVLVTSNISQTAVAKAAEEDVDSFIIKPYTIQSIQENLVSTISARIKPTPYMVKTEEGKKLIDEENYPEAIGVLKEALKLHPKPALALFYMGQAAYLQSQLKEAEGSFSSGLKYNSIHYKCLLGLYKMYVERSEWAEAYEVAKKIARFFPANPNRLAEIIRLAVRTKNFGDMQMYYDIFTSLEDAQTEMMVKYMGAGLYVSGKHFLLTKNLEEASRHFDQLAVSCADFTHLLRGMINALVENNQVDLAEKYLSRFPSTASEQPDFLISQYLVMSGKISSPVSSIVEAGLELYNRDIRDPSCLQIMINSMEKCERKPENLSQLKDELQKLILVA